MTTYVRADVVSAIVNDAQRFARAGVETIGMLAGRPFYDERGEYALVTFAATAEQARRSRAKVDTSWEDERRFCELLDSEAATLERIGWWHSHPNLRFFGYSGVDVANQRRVCEEAFQVGLLVCVDGAVSRLICYAGPHSVRLGGGYLRVSASGEWALLKDESLPHAKVKNARPDVGVMRVDPVLTFDALLKTQSSLKPASDSYARRFAADRFGSFDLSTSSAWAALPVALIP